MKRQVLIYPFAVFCAFSAYGAAPEEEVRFVAAAKQAFESKDSQAVLDLYYWEGASADLKQTIAKGTEITIQKAVGGVSLIPAPPGFASSKPTRAGGSYGPNLPVTNQLQVFTKAKPGQHAFIVYAVGEKDGKLFITHSVPGR